MDPEPSIRATRILRESIHPWAGEQVSRVVQYLFASDRSRTECFDFSPRTIEIERRDLRRRFRVFPSNKNYNVMPIVALATEQEMADLRHAGRHWRGQRKHVVGEVQVKNLELKINISYQATGEEQEMFGCVARRWIVRRRDERDQRFGENWSEEVTDAWFFDSAELEARFAGFSGDLLHHGLSCFTSAERPVINYSGERPSGLCAASETKSLAHAKLSDGEIRERSPISSARVISISEVSVPSSVFEPPRGFREIPLYPTPFSIVRSNVSRAVKTFLRISA